MATTEITPTEFTPAIKTYDEFLEALVWSYSTSNPNETHPEYQIQIDKECSHVINTLYMKHFLADMPDVQEGLRKYLKAVSACGRYGRDDYKRADPMFIGHIKLFIERGASIKDCTAYLMKTYEPKYLEDFSRRIEMKMPLVDAFWDQLDQAYIHSLTDWAAIKPGHWETIVFGYEADEAYPLAEADRDDDSVWFYMFMKYLSDKLKAL